MKQVARAMVVAIGFVVGGAVVAEAATNAQGVDASPVSNRITKYCDPVCELRAQDSAFSLLIEAYRQFQSRQIQIDYERRLRSAANLGNQPDSLVIGTTLNSTRTLRAWVEVLAEKERDLRLEQLQTRVVNFATAYQCVRKEDETALEEPVANKGDAPAAARELKTLRMLALGSPVSADFQTVVSRPAASIFLDSPPTEPWQDEVVGPCEDTATSASSTEPTR
jgi:hypothetical protein